MSDLPEKARRDVTSRMERDRRASTIRVTVLPVRSSPSNLDEPESDEKPCHFPRLEDRYITHVTPPAASGCRQTPTPGSAHRPRGAWRSPRAGCHEAHRWSRPASVLQASRVHSRHRYRSEHRVRSPRSTCACSPHLSHPPARPTCPSNLRVAWAQRSGMLEGGLIGGRGWMSARRTGHFTPSSWSANDARP